MTYIKDLLAMPIGQGTGGYTLHVKTFKKRWSQGKWWWQQCICNDETDEIIVEVRMEGNIQLSREFRVIIGKIAELDWLNKNRKGLRVLEYREPTQTADDWMAEADKVFAGELNEVRGKCRYGISIAFIRTGSHINTKNYEALQPSETVKDLVNEWVEFIITGK